MPELARLMCQMKACPSWKASSIRHTRWPHLTWSAYLRRYHGKRSDAGGRRNLCTERRIQRGATGNLRCDR
eukprot:6654388-Prymnesium_polylepis.1